MTQVTKTLILALGLCILFMTSGVQAQISWIQVESQRSINDTQGNRISKVYQERTQEIVVPSSAFKFDTV